MVSGKHKSNRLRKVFVRTPGSRTVVHRRKRKPSKAKCAIFGNTLAGVPHGRDSAVRKLSKSKRRPERPFGGVLSSKAMRFVLRMRAREESSGSQGGDAQ